MKTGKSKPSEDVRTLRLSDFAHGLQRAPWSTMWADARYGMMGNDVVGNCTAVAAHHLLQTWTQVPGLGYPRPTKQDAIATYSAFTGYDGTEPTDNGADMLAVLKKWRKQGLSTGHKIDGFLKIDEDSFDQMRQACWLFGGLYVGLALPKFAIHARRWEMQGSTRSPETRPYGGGGHAAIMVGCDEDKAIIVTWGRRIPVSWKFLETYCDEAYAVIADEWKLKDNNMFHSKWFDETVKGLTK